MSFDDDKREVKLSLRQADILEALANDKELLKQGGGVPDLQRGPEKYAVYLRSDRRMLRIILGLAGRRLSSIRSSDGLCSKLRLVPHGESGSGIFWMSSAT